MCTPQILPIEEFPPILQHVGKENVKQLFSTVVHPPPPILGPWGLKYVDLGAGVL
jgi:hypothetical protein